MGAAERRLAGAGDRHADHPLHHRAVLVAAGEFEAELGRQRHGPRGEVGRVGVERGDPLALLLVGLLHHPRLEQAVLHPLAQDVAERAGDLVAVAAAVGDRLQALAAAVVRGAAGEQGVQPLGGGPDPERSGAPVAVEDHDELGADALAAGVVPDLDRPDDARAVRLQPARRRPVEQQDARAVVRQGAEQLLRLLDLLLPALLEGLRDGVVGVPRLPELLDEGVALVVLVEGQEGRHLLVADQQVHRLQPVAVLLRELLDRLLLRLALRPRRLRGRRRAPRTPRGRGRQGEDEEGEERQTSPCAHSFHLPVSFQKKNRSLERQTRIVFNSRAGGTDSKPVSRRPRYNPA